jgi:hypothetical protein
MRTKSTSASITDRRYKKKWILKFLFLSRKLFIGQLIKKQFPKGKSLLKTSNYYVYKKFLLYACSEENQSSVDHTRLGAKSIPFEMIDFTIFNYKWSRNNLLVKHISRLTILQAAARVNIFCVIIISYELLTLSHGEWIQFVRSPCPSVLPATALVCFSNFRFPPLCSI